MDALTSPVTADCAQLSRDLRVAGCPAGPGHRPTYSRPPGMFMHCRFWGQYPHLPQTGRRPGTGARIVAFPRRRFVQNFTSRLRVRTCRDCRAAGPSGHVFPEGAGPCQAGFYRSFARVSGVRGHAGLARGPAAQPGAVVCLVPRLLPIRVSGLDGSRTGRSPAGVAYGWRPAPWSLSPPSELRITRVFPCVARGFKARASFMFAGCCWW